MAQSNIKLKSAQIAILKKITGEATGQKAVERALEFFLHQAKQREIVEVLRRTSFAPGFNPLALRERER